MPDYHVSKDGNDAGVGLEGDPWRTPAHALGQVGPRDNVFMHPGIYGIGAGLIIADKTGPVQVRAVHPGTVEWRLENYGVPIQFLNSSQWDFYDLLIRGLKASQAWTLVLSESSNALGLHGCDLTETQGHCIAARGTDGLHIDSCLLHPETRYDGTGLTMDGINANWWCKNLLVEDTRIWHTSHTGILLARTEDAVIRRTRVHDTSSHCVDLKEGVLSCLIERSRFHRAGSFRQVPDAKYGLAVFQGVLDVVYRRNVVSFCTGPAISVWAGAVGPLFVHHNTFYRNHTGNPWSDWGSVFGHYESGSAGSPRVESCDNIIVHDNSNDIIVVEQLAGNAWSSHHNLWHSLAGQEVYWHGRGRYPTLVAYQDDGYEEHSKMMVDPMFVDPDRGDFRLMPGSPAIDMASDGGNVGARGVYIPPAPPVKRYWLAIRKYGVDDNGDLLMEVEEV